ncbi:hypothetical protein AB3N61_09250 [Leptospira sp. WS58.C1]|uniref:hypothetical protein n=1 Tax=Leptospira cinconiae TaxID=3235173 RepID=UPI00349EE040
MPKTATKVVRKAEEAERGKGLGIPLPADLSERLTAYCEETGASKAKIARIALKQFLDSKKPKN